MKKIICMALCLAIFATMAISSTVAYFTDEETDVNVFQVGSVDIIQHEQQRGETALVDFENPTDRIHPMVATNKDGIPKTLQQPLVSGETISLRNPEYYSNYIDKIVTVENDGASEAYVRNIVAIPTGNADVEWLEIDWYSELNSGASDWATPDKVEDVLIDGEFYDLYVFKYIANSEKLPYEGDDITLPTLLGFGLSKHVNYDESVPTYYYQEPGGERTDISFDPDSLKILVATQAVQVAGFADFNHAFSETFGDITTENHPWDHLSSSYGYIDGQLYTWEQLLNAEPALVTMHLNDSEALWSFDPSITKLVINSNDVKKIWNGGTDKPNSKLETLVIGNGVEEIGGLAFDECASLKTVELPSTPIKINAMAFSETSIASINIPGSVTFEGTDQFTDCKDLTTVTLGEGITSIPQSCFYGCSALKEVNLPSTLKTIGMSSFGFCKGLELITLPTSLETIEASGFTWCENLSSIGPFTNVTSIGNSAFKNCRALKEICLPKALETIVEANKSIFTGCDNITIIYAS